LARGESAEKRFKVQEGGRKGKTSKNKKKTANLQAKL